MQSNTHANAANRSLTTLPASTECTTHARPTLATSDQAPPNWLRRLWERMTAMYGHAWVSVHGPSPQAGDGALTIHGETWSKVLSGISAQQLGHGLEACMASGGEFPPSAPRFRAMCLQIPTYAAMKAKFRVEDVSRGERASGPFARLMYQFMNSERFRYGDMKASEKALREAYELATDHVMRGGAYPEEPVAAIAHAPAPPRELSEAELAEKELKRQQCAARVIEALAEMKQELGLPVGEACE